MNSTQRRYADRLKEVIEESEKMEAQFVTPNPSTVNGIMLKPSPYFDDMVSLNAWLIKVQNIIVTAFSDTSTHFKRLQELTVNNTNQGYRIQEIRGLLIGSLDDLENGFLLGQEFMIAGEVFDSLLAETKYLLKYGHNQAAAILGRVVIEDALKRLARAENIDDTQKASQINIELRKAEKYNLSQERFVQGWLDIGNDAAHNKFQTYKKQDVEGQINGIESFIARYFTV